MLRDLAAEEDLLFLFAESQRPERRHAELANHLARQFGCLLDVVAGAGRHRVQEQLFGEPSAHHDRELTFEIRSSDTCADRPRATAASHPAPFRAE